MNHSSAPAPTRTIPLPADALDQQAHDALDALANGDPLTAAHSFRAVLAADPAHIEAHHGLIRALNELGQPEQAVAVALSLTVLTPDDPLAHTSLSIALQRGGHIPEAESAAARARILEWKQQLASPHTGEINLD